MAVLNKRAVVSAIEMYGVSSIRLPKVLGSASKTFDQLIESLFANSEQGFAYDPNDLSTMFQNTTGTVVPVTGAGQPVGLLLDKSKLLVRGENLAETIDDVTILDGGISKGTWDAQTRTMGNTSTTTHTSRPRFEFGFAAIVDAVYEVRIKFTGDLSALNSVSGLKLQPDGNVYGIIKPTSSTLNIQVITALTPTTSLSIAEFSVRQILGNHAHQTTSSMRPLLVASPQRLDYDTVDDKLITTLPAQLTGCTVIRSVPNVGTQILTNQTIPTPYNNNTDHCGLIVINRTLTASETSQITKLFDKAAGVWNV